MHLIFHDKNLNNIEVMKARLKKGVIIYLVLLGLGAGAYFGIGVAKGKYSQATGEINILSQPQGSDTLRPKTGVRVPGPGESVAEGAIQETGGGDSARARITADTTTRPLSESTMVALSVPDTASKAGPSQPGPASGKTDFPEIKPAVDLSSSGGLDIKIKPSEGPGTSLTDLGLGTGPKIKVGTGEQLGGEKSGGTKPATDISSGSSSASTEVLKLEKELESAYRNEHNLDKTLSIANQILKMDPTNSKAALYTKIVKAERKALAYEDAGESEKALAEWKKILSWDPGNRWAQKGVERNE